MTIVSSDLPFTSFVIPFSFLWPFYRQIFRLQLLSFYSLSYDHCIVRSSVYIFCNFILFLMTIVSSDLPFTAFVILFSFLWPLYRQIFRLQLLSFFSLSYDHCIVWSSVYSFCHFFLFLMTIVSSDLPFTAFVISFSFLWPLYRLIFVYIFCHFILFLMTIVSSDLPFTAFVISFSFLWPFYRQIFRLQLLSFYSLSYDHCIVRSSVYIFCNFILFLMTILSSDLPFTALSFYSLSYDHCIVRSSVYIFCNFILFLMTIVSSDLPFTAFVILFSFLWPLYRLIFRLQLLVTPLISSNYNYL